MSAGQKHTPGWPDRREVRRRVEGALDHGGADPWLVSFGANGIQTFLNTLKLGQNRFHDALIAAVKVRLADLIVERL